MELNEVQEFINSNKENDDVKAFISSIAPKPDFNQAMESPDFQKSLKSYTDSQISKAVEAFKEKGFKSAVEQEVEKRLEAKEKKQPWEIKLQEMERKQNELMTQLQEKERAELRATNKTNALKALSERKLPTDLLDYLVSEEEETTQANLDTFAKMMEGYSQNLKQEILKGNNVKVPGDNTISGGGIQEPGEGASKAEWDAYWKATKSK